MNIVIRVFPMIVLSGAGVVPCARAMQGEKPPKTIEEALPWQVRNMRNWPDAATLRGEKRMDPNALVIASPKQISWTWIKRVLAASWVPPAETEMIFIREEIGKMDVSRIQWDRNDYHLEVAQTASVFCMKLVLLRGGGTGLDANSRLEYARQLCLRLFNPEGRTWSHEPGKAGTPIPVADLNKKIAAFSFDRAKSEELPTDKAVVGGATLVRDMPVVPGPERRSKGVSADGRYITVTEDEWHYWWRNVYWWNDGKTVGFYFLKTEGLGSWFASWSSNIDVNWFHEPWDRSGRPLPAR